MKRTLYLHIGSPRTATTSIQRFMVRNFDNLLAQGCLYPYRVARHFQLFNRLFNGSRTIDEVAADFNKRGDEKNVEITRFVISDEDTCMQRDLSILQRFREHFDVKIVFAIRRQDLWLESWYLQNVKWQWNPDLSHSTFEEFLERRSDCHWLHYDHYVQHLEDLFGAENILLSVFEKEQQPNGPVVDFCSLIGLDMLTQADAVPHTNSSMSAVMAEFTRHLPLDKFDYPERELLRRALETVDRVGLGHKGKHIEHLMPPTQREEILAEYTEGNNALAQRYFKRDNLFLHPLPAEDAPLARLELPTNSADLVKNIVAPLLQQLVVTGAISAAGTEGKN